MNDSYYRYVFPLYILVRKNGRRYEYLQLDPEECINDEKMKNNIAQKWLDFSELMTREFIPEVLEKNEFKPTALMGLLPMEVI